MSWEIVGYGNPVEGDAVSRQAESNDWHNVEAGAHAPTDNDIADSTEAVIKVTDDHGVDSYWTIHLDPFDDLSQITDYIEYVWLEQYE